MNETYSANFIQRCQRLLVEQANYSSQQIEQVRRKLKYEAPSNKDFQSMCDDFILGYFTYEYIDKNYHPSKHPFLVRGDPRSSSLPSKFLRPSSPKTVGKGLQASPTLHRQRSLSHTYRSEGSPVRSKKLMRSQSLVELPTFTNKPEKGAAERISRHTKQDFPQHHCRGYIR